MPDPQQPNQRHRNQGRRVVRHEAIRLGAGKPIDGNHDRPFLLSVRDWRAAI